MTYEFQSKIQLTQCYHCFEWCHKRSECPSRNNPVICSHCGGIEHDYKSCSNLLYCCNCQGPHAATYRGCPAHRRAMLETLDLMKRELVEDSWDSPDDSLIEEAALNSTTKEEFLDRLFNMSKSPQKSNKPHNSHGPITFVHDQELEDDYDLNHGSTIPMQKQQQMPKTQIQPLIQNPLVPIGATLTEFIEFASAQPEDRFYQLTKNGMKKINSVSEDKSHRKALVDFQCYIPEMYKDKEKPCSASMLFVDTKQLELITIYVKDHKFRFFSSHATAIWQCEINVNVFHLINMTLYPEDQRAEHIHFLKNWDPTKGMNTDRTPDTKAASVVSKWMQARGFSFKPGHRYYCNSHCKPLLA